MKAKSKPCAGIGKAKGFKGCGVMTTNRRAGLCTKCYPKYLLEDPRGQETLKKATLQVTKLRRDLAKAREQENTQKKLQTLLINVRKVCHDYIKQRDKGLPCISCGKPWASDFQAGHYYKAELYSNIKFNELNIHGQCERCNIFLNGNFEAYSDRLGFRIGKDKKLEIDKLADGFKSTYFNWDRSELEKIRKYYREKLNAIK